MSSLQAEITTKEPPTVCYNKWIPMKAIDFPMKPARVSASQNRN